MFIRIIKRPDGEAPEWVRDAWIGVRLPTLDEQPTDRHGVGVLSGPRGAFSQFLAQIMGKTEIWTGYRVDGAVAIEALAQSNEAAANWWQTNCDWLLKPGIALIFRAEECSFEPGPLSSAPENSQD